METSLVIRYCHRTARLFGFDLMRNFAFPYFQEILQNFGEDGIYLYRLGSGIMFTSLLEEVEVEHG